LHRHCDLLMTIDQAMVANAKAGLHRIMDRFVMVAHEYNMKMNVKWTIVSTVSRPPRAELVILVNGVKLEQVTEFRYLGSIITADNRCERDVCVIIARAKEAFNRKTELKCGRR